MKKRTFLIAVLFVLGISLALADQAQAQVFKWRMATCRTPALTPFHESDVRFAEIASRMSGGKLAITVYPAGELMPAFEVFDGVRKGVVEMGGDWSTYWTGKNTAFDLFCAMGFMMHAADWMTWLYQGGGLKLGQELYGKYNIMYFPMNIVGPESGYRTNKPIRNLADFKGAKLRTGVLQTIWLLEQIGAKPVRIPGGEIYMALKLGTIDGAEFSIPSTDWGIKFQEISKYWVIPAGWHQVGTVGNVIINMDAWKKLPPDLQAIVENAAMANMTWSYAKGNWDSIGAVERFKAAGIQVTELDREAQEKLEELCVQFMEMESARNPDYAKIAKSMVDFLKGMDKVKQLEGPFRSGSMLKRYPVIK
ncbi:MAG: TRAP transporter substrate-binding protein DctP [Deltaproteobacteria bacterium]|nr:TRAP transporter substrate-binding protein DctP [Deltaproteobacteria bacterium]